MRHSACLVIGFLIVGYVLARKNAELDLVERLRQVGF